MIPQAKFQLGQILATPGALEALQRSGQSPFVFLSRHAAGDWGDVCPEDWRANDRDLRHGGRLLSAYHTAMKEKLWIITEADRSATTILFPEEY